MSIIYKVVKKLRWLFTIIIFVLFGWIYWYQQPRVCMSGLETDFIMSDDLAISLSRQALKDKGFDVSNVIPTPYWSEYPEKLFARNGRDPNSGYVLWQRIDEKTTSYSVSIRRRGDKIYCDAGKSL